MPNLTTHGLYKPLVNDPTDQDVWGGYLNDNADTIDGWLSTRTYNYNFADYEIQHPILVDYGEKVNTAGNISGATAINCNTANHYTATLTGNATFTFTNPSPTGNACPLRISLIQDGTGSRTVTWPASVVWPGGSAPTLTTTAGRRDEFVFITEDGGTKWTGSVRGLNYA